MPNREWKECSHHILAELQRLAKNEDKVMERLDEIDRNINQKMHSLHIDIERLKVRAAAWGTIAGFIISSIVGIFTELFLRKN